MHPVPSHRFTRQTLADGILVLVVRKDQILATGVDVNECPKAPGYIVDSALKRVDNAVFDFIKRWLEEGTAEGGFYDYGLSDGGTDLAVFAFPDEDTECVLEDYPDIVEQIRKVRQQIIDGELVIPDPLFAE